MSFRRDRAFGFVAVCNQANSIFFLTERVPDTICDELTKDRASDGEESRVAWFWQKEKHRELVLYG